MKHFRKWLSVFCLALVIFMALPVVLPADSTLSVVAEAAGTVKLNKTRATINAGTTLQLKLTGSSASVTWKSSDTNVATVSKKGLVSAKKGGTVTITATAARKNYTCRITVNPALSGSASSVTLKKGASASVTLYFKLTGVKLTGEISNSSVATISIGKQSNGKVPLTIKGKTAGNAVVKIRNAKTGDIVKINVRVENSSGGKLNKGDVQSLFGKTLRDANALLPEKLTKGKAYYVNSNIGANVNSNGKIDYLYVYKGSGYNLFGVYPGMAWSKALTTVASSPMKWQEYFRDSSGIWYTSAKYTSRMLYIGKKSGKVGEVYYCQKSYLID